MPVKDYRSDLLVRLADPDYAAHYLKAALEETLKDGDHAAFLLALSNVAETQKISRAASNDFQPSGLVMLYFVWHRRIP